MKVIDTRRSVRQFTEAPVQEASILEILKAGMQAPSAGNQQPWEFIVIKDVDTRFDLSQMSPFAEPIKRAPLAIVLLANLNNLNFPQFWHQDLSNASQNMLLEVVNQSLGAVWLGIAPDEDRTSYIKDCLSLPEGVEPFCILAIGHPMDSNANHYVNRFKEERVYYEFYR